MKAPREVVSRDRKSTDRGASDEGLGWPRLSILEEDGEADEEEDGEIGEVFRGVG